MSFALRVIRALGRRVKLRYKSLRTPTQLARFDKIQFGAGAHPLVGWANLDLEGDNLIWDLRKPLPLQEAHIRYAYSEHFIEHVSRETACMILTNLRQAMIKGGVLRISTPDLAALLGNYVRGDLISMDHAPWHPSSLCNMVNEGMRSWGHTFLYDEPELRLLVEEAGFANVRRMRWCQSEHEELQGLETRPDYGDLIIEADVVQQ